MPELHELYKQDSLQCEWTRRELLHTCDSRFFGGAPAQPPTNAPTNHHSTTTPPMDPPKDSKYSRDKQQLCCPFPPSLPARFTSPLTPPVASPLPQTCCSVLQAAACWPGVLPPPPTHWPPCHPQQSAAPHGWRWRSLPQPCPSPAGPSLEHTHMYFWGGAWVHTRVRGRICKE